MRDGTVARVSLVFLLDVDNTLIDNDAAKSFLEGEVRALLTEERAIRFWQLYEEVREERSFVDYLETLERFHLALPDEREPARLDRAVLGLPYERFLYPATLPVIERLWSLGTPAVLSDGDPLYQPLKIARAGIDAAVRGNVLVYAHKEAHLAEVLSRFPADHYAIVDDKAPILGRVKRTLGERVTTVHVQQGHYAAEPSPDAPPDVSLGSIAGLLGLPATVLAGGSGSG